MVRILCEGKTDKKFILAIKKKTHAMELTTVV